MYFIAFYLSIDILFQMLIINTIFGYWLNDFKTIGVNYVRGCVQTTWTEFWAIDPLATMYVDTFTK